MRNDQLSNARSARNDEFYTQLADVEKEMNHYKEHFKGKVVYCNCDDPRVSAFFKYFSINFEHLGLKKLITSCYKSRTPLDFSKNDSEKAVYLIYEGDKNNNKIVDDWEVEVKQLKGDGDFRSPESIELLKQSDIVVTNPPFSLFREYIAQLMEYNKKFIIIGNMNAITYKETFQLIKDNKVWYGPSISSGDREFGVPESYPLTAASHRVDKAGNKFVRVKGVRWFTNLEHDKRKDELVLWKKYTPDEYPKYDNYDAINVNKTKDIPADYDDVMGVPISFLDKFNPNQFEILNCNDYRSNSNVPKKPHGLIKDKEGAINGKPVYVRILIKHRKGVQP